MTRKHKAIKLTSETKKKDTKEIKKNICQNSQGK